MGANEGNERMRICMRMKGMYVDVTPPFAEGNHTRLPGFARSSGSFVDRGVSSDEY